LIDALLYDLIILLEVNTINYMFEKMDFKKTTENNVGNIENTKNVENNTMGKFEKYTVMLALFATSLLALESTAANTGDIDNKEKKEYSIEGNKQIIQEIKDKLNVINKEIRQTINDASVLSHKSEQNTLITTKDNKYTVVMDNRGKMAFLDEDSDGQLDAMVLNGGKDGTERNLVMNIHYLAKEVEYLMKEADIIKGTPMGRDIKVLRFNVGKKETTCVDLLEAKSGTISWEESVKLFEDGQKLYSEKLQEIVKSVEK